jgi:hypothetical protein
MKSDRIEIPFQIPFEDLLVEYEYTGGEPPSRYSPSEPESAHISSVSIQGRMRPNGKRETLEITGFLDCDTIFSLEDAVIDYERQERGI